MTDPFDLDRFVAAQAGSYERLSHASAPLWIAGYNAAWDARASSSATKNRSR